MKAVLLLVSLVLANVHLAQAQKAESIRGIGYLDTGFKPPKEFSDAVHKHDYIEHQNINFEYRSAEREERLTELASDLVQRNFSVIVASGAGSGLAARAATETVRFFSWAMVILFSLALAGSLAHPRGNVTGITELSPELTAEATRTSQEAFP